MVFTTADVTEMLEGKLGSLESSLRLHRVKVDKLNLDMHWHHVQQDLTANDTRQNRQAIRSIRRSIAGIHADQGHFYSALDQLQTSVNTTELHNSLLQSDVKLFQLVLRQILQTLVPGQGLRGGLNSSTELPAEHLLNVSLGGSWTTGPAPGQSLTDCQGSRCLVSINDLHQTLTGQQHQLDDISVDVEQLKDEMSHFYSFLMTLQTDVAAVRRIANELLYGSDIPEASEQRVDQTQEGRGGQDTKNTKVAEVGVDLPTRPPTPLPTIPGNMFTQTQRHTVRRSTSMALQQVQQTDNEQESDKGDTDLDGPIQPPLTTPAPAPDHPAGDRTEGGDVPSNGEEDDVIIEEDDDDEDGDDGLLDGEHIGTGRTYENELEKQVRHHGKHTDKHPSGRGGDMFYNDDVLSTVSDNGERDNDGHAAVTFDPTTTMSSTDEEAADQHLRVKPSESDVCALPGIMVGAPHVVATFDDAEFGSWMRDPESRDNHIYATLGQQKIKVVHEYNSTTALVSHNSSREHRLQIKCTGTGHVMLNGSFFCNKFKSNRMAKMDMRTGVSRTQGLRKADYGTSHRYKNGISSDISFAVDEIGLWVIYTGAAHDDNIVIARVDPETLTVQQTWETRFKKKNSVNHFVVCGRLYVVAYNDNHRLELAYVYDTRRGRELPDRRAPYQSSGENYDIESINYNPKDSKLYTWISSQGQSRLVQHGVFFTSK